MAYTETIAIRKDLSTALNCLVVLKKLGATAKLESIGSDFVIKVPSEQVDKYKHLFKGSGYK